MTDEEILVTLTRQGDRIKNLEHRVSACEGEKDVIRDIALSVNKLAVNMEHMLAEQKEQGKRLTALERAPGEGYSRMKETVLRSIVTTVLGAILGALLTLILR